MPSDFDLLAAEFAAPEMLRTFGARGGEGELDTEAVVIRGPDGAEQRLPAMLGQVMARRDEMSQGSQHEDRLLLEEMTLTVASAVETPMASTVVIPAHGLRGWTIEEAHREGVFTRLRVTREATTARQRAGLERRN